MLRPDTLAAGIEVVGQLSILADSSPLDVAFKGGVIEVNLPNLRTAINLCRSLSRGERRARMRSIQSTLAVMGLELQFWVKHRDVGRLTPASRRSWLAVGLGVDPLELRIGAILATLFSR